MAFFASYKKHLLRFKFEAGTSRGSFTQKDTWFVKTQDDRMPGIFGLGEAAPLPKLSIDDRPDFEDRLSAYCRAFSEIQSLNDLYALEGIHEFPSILFAFETALLDLQNGGRRIVFENAFSRGQTPIQINGLIWMGEKSFMLEQIQQKLAEGYSCLKLKIGAIDFEQELSLLHYIRERFDESRIVLRVDANGAFSPAEALPKLEKLSRFGIHSIEQPIKAGQWETMRDICRQSPVPIALDEELIGITGIERKAELLQNIAPQFIIIKPTLLGGIKASEEWIDTAQKHGIGWWATSALEANPGLNAVAQFCGQYANPLPQGLGTGQLFLNNVETNMQLKGGWLGLEKDGVWGTDIFL